jgi:hypothetical protein
MYLFAGAFIALIAIYIGFTMLRTTYEGLGNSADSENIAIIAKTKKLVDDTNVILKSLTSDPTSYINLLTSYKNKTISDAIKTTLSEQKDASFAMITDYDEAIDYLKTLGVSDTVVPNTAIDADIIANNAAINKTLTDLTADNQAYIDLLTSYKNKAISDAILAAAGATTPLLKISEYDIMIEYLRTMGGIVGQEPPHVPTTRNISLSPP